MMKRIAVIYGSGSVPDEIYRKEASRLGEIIAERRKELIYGRTCAGLLKPVINGAISRGGEVARVLPVFIKEKGIPDKIHTRLILVNTIQERDAKMFELTDGFIALPGDFETMNELFGILTRNQSCPERKPVGLFNICGFYDPLKILVKSMADKGFLKKAYRNMLIISDNIDNLLNHMEDYHTPEIHKWVNRDNKIT